MNKIQTLATVVLVSVTSIALAQDNNSGAAKPVPANTVKEVKKQVQNSAQEAPKNAVKEVKTRVETIVKEAPKGETRPGAELPKKQVITETKTATPQK
jgi:membrane-bound ClpP family serine protease